MIVRSALVKVGHRQTKYKNPLVRLSVQGGFYVNARNQINKKREARHAPPSRSPR